MAIRHGAKLTVANIGDCRAVLCDRQDQAVPLSQDHKPNVPKEHERIKAAGGFIAMFGVWRVQGILAISRALGDHFLKQPPHPFVIPDPDLTVSDVSDAKFLILATDGLWDVIANQEAVDTVIGRWSEPLRGADVLVRTAIAKGSTDNVTVMIIKL